jgi:hypothetical protein
VPQVSLVVHGHFYQPPRENPWTETVPVEPSAAPFHDWNERITAECYRPNGWARIVDEHERVVALENNYGNLSFNIGPTLAAWLADHAREVLDRMVSGDGVGGGGIAQAYNHLILPLATERDIRTQVRWGLADFRLRFGRRAEGMWLPETAVNATVLRVLAQEGVRFTILAPTQAARIRPVHQGRLLGSDEPWIDVATAGLDTRRAYRWCDEDDETLGLDIVFYDGALSHDVAFGMRTTSAQVLVGRVLGAAGGEGLVCIAADGETFGHHHHFAERALAYALPVEAPRRGVTVTTVGAFLDAEPSTWQVEVHESSWSCAHGVERWRRDCGCSTGGVPGAQQRWREPLREALDRLRVFGDEVFERRGPVVLADPEAARDDYIDVVLGTVGVDEFAERHVVGDLVEALTLLEHQRHAMLMYTSCGWFFWDLAGIETVQILRYAGRSMDLLAELDEKPPVDDFLDILGRAESNQPGEGTGRDVWERHVLPSRVDPQRVVAHVALADLLEGKRPGGALTVFDVQPVDHVHADRGAISLCAGTVEVVHQRTRRRTRHAYAALHLGGLEVMGAVRDADPSRDAGVLQALLAAFDNGERVTTLLRVIGDELGPSEFGLEAALPDTAEQIVAGAAQSLEERFALESERLFAENRATFRSLTTAGFTLPDDLRIAVEVAVDRRLEASLLDRAHDDAVAIAQEAIEAGLRTDGPRARDALDHSIADAVIRVVGGDDTALPIAQTLLRLAGTLGISVDLRRVQEVLYDALLARPTPSLNVLGVAVGLAVERLGQP